ncbi:MAG TPA: transposase [Ktedonobacteraceae bacterium]
MAKQQKTYTREFKVEAVQLVKRNGTSPIAYFILHKSKQSARSMSDWCGVAWENRSPSGICGLSVGNKVPSQYNQVTNVG